MQSVLRVGFLVAVVLSLVNFNAPWVLFCLIFSWFIVDASILKSTRSTISDFKGNIDLVSIGIFFFVYIIIFLKIFIIESNF